jgi:hypothetical protein
MISTWYAPTILEVTKMASSEFSSISILVRWKKMTLFTTLFEIDARPIGAFDFVRFNMPLSNNA